MRIKKATFPAFLLLFVLAAHGAWAQTPIVEPEVTATVSASEDPSPPLLVIATLAVAPSAPAAATPNVVIATLVPQFVSPTRAGPPALPPALPPPTATAIPSVIPRLNWDELAANGWPWLIVAQLALGAFLLARLLRGKS